MSGNVQGDDEFSKPLLDKDVDVLMKKARRAYTSGDIEASRAIHDLKTQAEEAHQQESGKYVKPLVFGGLDGIVTTFASVAGASGIQEISSWGVLVLGLANLVADGISMGMGEYLSEQAERDYTAKERERELWECENYIEGERQEMVDLYVKKGMSREDATTVIDILSKDHQFFTDIMMVEELGLLPPDPDPWAPVKAGFVMFLAFLAFGCVPLLPFAFVFNLDTHAAQDLGGGAVELRFIVSVGMAGLTMFLLGAFKSRFTTQRWFVSGFLMLLNGAIAASAAFVISFVLGKVGPGSCAPSSATVVPTPVLMPLPPTPAT